jgi:hypothetical protein
MAGWTYTGGVAPANSAWNPDGGQKVTAFPALGAATQAAWWQTFAFETGCRFAKEALGHNSGLLTVKVSANNSTGDTNGVGTLTITIVTT